MSAANRDNGEAELLKLVGDPAEVAEGLARSRAAASALSADHPRFIDRYKGQWVALHDHEVLAANTLEDLLSQLDGEGISREHVIVRYIERDERVLIL